MVADLAAPMGSFAAWPIGRVDGKRRSLLPRRSWGGGPAVRWRCWSTLPPSLHRMVLRLFSYASPVRVPPASLLGRMIRRRLGACEGRPLGASLLSALAVALSNASLPACGIWVAGWRPLSRQVWGERSVALAPRHGRSGCWGPVPAPLDAAPPAVAPPAASFPVCYEDYEDPFPHPAMCAPTPESVGRVPRCATP